MLIVQVMPAGGALIPTLRLTLLVPSAWLVLMGAHEGSALAANPEMSRCIDANESAIGLRADHRLREAREQSLACAATTCPAAVRTVCMKRVSELSHAMPTIVLQVKDAGGGDLRQAHVTMDSQPFTETLDGVGLEADPGDHTIAVYVPGYPVLERSVLVYEGRKDQVVAFQLAPPSPPTASTPQPTARPWAAWSTLGVGALSVTVGSVLGILTFTSWSSATSACGAGGSAKCTPTGIATARSERGSAETDGALSTAAFVVGGGLLATSGVFFWLDAHPHVEKKVQPIAIRPSVGPTGAGLQLGGTF